MIAEAQWFCQNLKKTGLFFLSLALVGGATRMLEEPAWERIKKSQPEFNLKGMEEALGQGIVIGLLGGFRTVIADFLFIKANVHWEKKEREKTEVLLNLVTEIDPRPMFFWLNSARMIAYDIPVWRIQALGGFSKVPQVVQEKIKTEQAHRGLSIMNRAERFHPEDYRVPLERAQIFNNRLNDKEKAAQWYLVTSTYEQAPFFAGRIYAQLLRDLGRKKEAYYYLKQNFALLPDDDVTAVKGVVLSRIRKLEGELNIPESLRLPFQPLEREKHPSQAESLESSHGLRN